MAGVFISYRRDDSQGFAGRLADDLDRVFGPEWVFRDVEIPIGNDFTKVLRRAVAASDILLVVIGPHWAAKSSKGFRSRLFEPDDWVRAEIEAAFEQGKQLVPVLVGDARMPRAEELPDGLARLPLLQAAVLSDRHWDTQVGELAQRLRELAPGLRPGAAPPKGETPAQVLRELGERLLDEVVSKGGAHQSSIRKSPGLITRFARKLRGLVGTSIVLGLAYLGLRLFGDESLLKDLDAVEARLLVGWERLQVYIRSL